MIALSYIKESSWIKQFGHLNSLYMRATRVITNYISIREYCLRFFPRENFNCLYRLYLVETRQPILYECKRYNKYWNLYKTLLSYLIVFLEYNLGAFSFYKEIT